MVRPPFSPPSSLLELTPLTCVQWYRGPLAVSIAGPSASAGGDIGFETGMAVAGAVFVPCRWIERRVFGR